MTNEKDTKDKKEITNWKKMPIVKALLLLQ